MWNTVPLKSLPDVLRQSPCRMSQPSLRCSPDWMMMPLTMTIIPNTIGAMLLTLPNLVKFQPADFKALTRIFSIPCCHMGRNNVPTPQHHQWTVRTAITTNIVRIGLLVIIATATLRNATPPAQWCKVCLADDDRPPYHWGHASVQEDKTAKPSRTWFKSCKCLVVRHL